ncbi:MAG: hypothetical protein HY319_06840 [Armatimonadetes bacterium]|nr:hypothetical protein [Armatimonadota bacterium]
MRVRGAWAGITLLLLVLAGCSGGGGSLAPDGVSDTGPGPSSAGFRLTVRLDDSVGRGGALARLKRPASVRVEMTDPASGIPVTAPAEAPFPATGDTVSVTFFMVPPGNWNVVAYGLNAGGQVILQSDHEIINVLPGTAGSTSLTLSGKPSTIRFLTPPVNGVEDQTLPHIVVEVLDGEGARTTADIPITLAFGSNPGGSSLLGTTTVISAQGLATFVDISLDQPGIGYTLTASGEDVDSVASPTFEIASATNPLVPTRVAFLSQPTDVEAGAIMTPVVTVAIQDQNGVVVTTATEPVSLAIANNPGEATLNGTTTVNAVNGVATFADLSLSTAGVGYTLQATSGALAPDLSDPFEVTSPPPPPPTPTQLIFISQPTDALAGSTLGPAISVELRDMNGILVPSATDPVTIAFDANPGAATLNGTKTVNAINGVATFSDLSVSAAGTGYTLQVTSGSLTPDTSDPFDIFLAGMPMFCYFAEGYSAGAGAGMLRGLRLDEPSGFLMGTTPGDPYPVADNPAFAALDRFFNYLFTTHTDDGALDDFLLNSLIDPVSNNGQITMPFAATNLGPGIDPNQVVAHPYLARIYYAQRSAARVGTFPYNPATGALGAGTTVNVGQEPVSVAHDPNGVQLYVGDQGAAPKIHIFDVNGQGTLSGLRSVALPAGSTGVRMVVNRADTRLYAAIRVPGGQSFLRTYSIAANGNLTFRNDVNTRPQPSGLRLLTRGATQFLYVACRGDAATPGAVAVFSINGSGDPGLLLEEPQTMGTHPEDLALATDGNHLYVTTHNGTNPAGDGNGPTRLLAFKIDAVGMLSPSAGGFPLTVGPNPFSLEIAKAPDPDFASRTISLTFGSSAPPLTPPAARGPLTVLGPPDNALLSLGAGAVSGTVTVEFRGRAIIQDQTVGNDLKVYERGTAAETYRVDVSQDNVTYFFAGQRSGIGSIDLPAGVPTGSYRFVRITDVPGGAGGPFFGADIDAVEILP